MDDTVQRASRDHLRHQQMVHLIIIKKMQSASLTTSKWSTLTIAKLKKLFIEPSVTTSVTSKWSTLEQKINK